MPTMFGGRVSDRFGVCAHKPSVTVRAAPAFSLSGRMEKQGAEKKVPGGPCHYNPKVDALQKRSRGCVFGTQARILSTNRRAMTPAPTLVLRDEDPSSARSPRYGFGRTEHIIDPVCAEKLQERKASTPGPGQYSANHPVFYPASSNEPSGPQFSFGQRGPREPIEPETSEVTPKLKSPGPLTYKVTTAEAWTVPSTPRCCFGTSPRMKLNDRSKPTPGPGQYRNVRATCRGVSSGAESAPKWSMTERAADHCLDFHTF